MSKTVLFQAIQFSISLVLFDPQIGPYQVLSPQARVNLEAIAMKGYSAFPKVPPSLFRVISRTLVVGGGVSPLCRKVVCIVYSPNRLGKKLRFVTMKNLRDQLVKSHRHARYHIEFYPPDMNLIPQKFPDPPTDNPSTPRV